MQTIYTHICIHNEEQQNTYYKTEQAEYMPKDMPRRAGKGALERATSPTAAAPASGPGEADPYLHTCK